MGVDAADYDRSGHPHIVVGNFHNEMLGLYHNEDGDFFVDVAPRTEVGRASLLSVTWAVFFLDYDLDGFLDIFAANGGTEESQGMDRRARLSQRPLLLRNSGNGTFDNVTATLGDAFNRPLMGRWAAYADFDGDGDLDLVIATLAGPPHVFRNDGGQGHNWLRVRAVGSRSNRSGLGTVVRRDELVGNSMADGAQWVELRVAERVDIDVRAWARRTRVGDDSGMAVGEDPVVRGSGAESGHRGRRGARPCRIVDSRVFKS